ncbi:uncharacterized protein (TIGR02594 family) [Haloferula luteola]|uniref:Uncharacterized protein (TIGR02594 family) n=1 Tax=Haloferula luteola TaxID=595692 RepID=A0A840UZ68_9BACT|nr:TIGR02594 family protein [Haloferula luteola]MBB5351072.1 uncharacterized protein (TIGR02594 family) [Haloferula luteola]
MTISTYRDLQTYLGITADNVPRMQTVIATAAALQLPLPVTSSLSRAWKAVQRYVEVTVDGEPGPETLGGIIRELVRMGKLPTLDPYGMARTYLGCREIPGSRDNPLIVAWHRRIATWISDDETAWCSAFANAMCQDCEYERSGKLNARSWLEVGQSVELAQAKPGDVVVLWRGSRSGWEGHVAFFEHYNANRDLIYMLGGNQNNEVNVTGYATNRLLSIRRIRPLSRAEGKSSKIL